MDTDFILCKQLTMRISAQTILNQLEFSIAQGDSVAVIGANGSGKSTLLRILCGIIRPTAGSIRIAGMDYIADKLPLIKRLIGFAPDTPPLYMNDTVDSYLNFVAALKKVPKSQMKMRINNCLEIFDLTAVRNAHIYTLSKGTQQRINLAQALLNDPQILILDEPTNALDTQQCENFCKHLKLLQSEKITLIIASHQYTDVVPLCNYMLRINNSSIQKILTPLNTKDVKQTNDQIHYST